METIQELSVIPRHNEEEYEYTSDFLEWFYYNIYREHLDNYPVISSLKQTPEYEYMHTLCKILIDMNRAKLFDDDTLIEKYTCMKEWIIYNFKSYIE